MTHGSGRSAGFGELAALAATQPRPTKPALKTPAQFKLIGQPRPRLETAAKLNGSARFGIDVQPAGLLHASLLMCPTLGGTLLRFDASKAETLPGVKKVFAVASYNGSPAGVAGAAG